MPRTAIIDTATGALLLLDPAQDAEGNPILPEGLDTRAVELSDAELAKLSQPGSYTVDAQGIVTVTPLTAEQVAIQQEETAALEERTASTTDMRDTAANIIRRMDEIASDPTQTDTTTEVRQAVRDTAQAVKRITRYLAAQAG